MKIDNLESALKTQSMLIASHERAENELNRIKRGIIEINKIIKQYKQLEKPYILHFEFLSGDNSNLSYEYETKEEMEKEKEIYKEMFSSNKKSFFYFTYNYGLTEENKEKYRLLETGRILSETNSNILGFYRLMHSLLSSENNITNQKFFILPDNNKYPISNLIDVHVNLLDLIEKIKEVKIENELNITNAFSTADIPFIKKFFTQIKTNNISINLTEIKNDENTLIQSKYINAEDVSKNLIIEILLNIDSE